MDPAPWVRSGGPVGQPPKAGAFGRSPGSRENPWAFFGYFLSQQKVTPRRGGETRQRAFRTRQDCEGADCRVAVKGNKTITYQNTVPRKKPKPPKASLLEGGGFRMKTGGRLSSARHTQRACRPQGSLFKKRPCGPVLKDKQQKPKAPGAPAAG